MALQTVDTTGWPYGTSNTVTLTPVTTQTPTAGFPNQTQYTVGTPAPTSIYSLGPNAYPASPVTYEPEVIITKPKTTKVTTTTTTTPIGVVPLTNQEASTHVCVVAWMSVIGVLALVAFLWVAVTWAKINN